MRALVEGSNSKLFSGIIWNNFSPSIFQNFLPLDSLAFLCSAWWECRPWQAPSPSSPPPTPPPCFLGLCLTSTPPHVSCPAPAVSQAQTSDLSLSKSVASPYWTLSKSLSNHPNQVFSISVCCPWSKMQSVTNIFLSNILHIVLTVSLPFHCFSGSQIIFVELPPKKMAQIPK